MNKIGVWLALPVPWMAAGVLLWFMSLGNSGGAAFLVNDSADTVDAAPGDGVCETAPGNGGCTLRAAIQESNALPGFHSIHVPAGTFTLTIPGSGEDGANTGDLDILKEVTITGASPDVTTIDGSGLDRVFHIVTNFQGTVYISGLSIQNGAADSGAGIFIQQSRIVITGTRLSANTAGFAGGGIHAASAFLTLTTATIDNNVVTSFGGDGGGISANGSYIWVQDTVIYSNTASAATSYGGGLTIFGWATIVNSTISRNSAVNGGAIRLGIGDHVITNTTIASNTAVTGGGLYDDPLYFGNTTLNNTIIAGNSPANCANDGQIFSQGHNLDSGSSCGFSATGDLTNTNPMLSPLQDNGGPTWSHSLTTGSPAVDTADNDTCPNTDQRGAPRPLDGDLDGLSICDIGAYELSQYQIYLPAVVN